MGYKNRADLFGKVEWEGGMEAALEYGLRLKDLPQDDDELRDAWADMERAWLAYEPLGSKVYEMLEEASEGEI